MTAIDRTSPHAFWKYSNEYFRAALIVQPRPKSRADNLRQRVSVPAYFLAGHAIELALKSFLRKRGMAAEELRFKPYGHDLEALISEAKRRKLGTAVKVSRTERKALAFLNRTYRVKELEYLTVGTKNLPAYESLISLAEKLVMSLQHFVTLAEPNHRLKERHGKRHALSPTR